MPVKGDQHVQTERHDLETQEDDDQVVRLGHEDRTRRGGESEDLVLGAAHAFAHRPVVGDQARHQKTDRDDAGRHHAEAVQHDGVRDRRRGAGPVQTVPLEEGDHQHRDRGADRDRGRDGLGDLGAHERREEDEHDRRRRTG